MNYAGVNFNELHYKDKTEAEFIAHESHHGLGEKQLKEAYFFMPHEFSPETKAAIEKIEKSKIRLQRDTEKPSK